MRRERVAQILLVGFMAWVFYAALGPAPEGPEIPHLDKLMHALCWGFMAALCLVAYPGKWRTALGVSAAHGGLTEVMQGTLVQGRSAEWLDWAADLLGAVIVVASVSWARRRQESAA